MARREERTQVRLPPGRQYARPLRLFAAALFACWDVDVETVEDLRVAITEACTLLWGRHGDDWELVAELRNDGHTIIAELQLCPLEGETYPEPGTRPVRGADRPAVGGDEALGERLLDELTDWYRYEADQQRVVFHRSLR